MARNALANRLAWLACGLILAGCEFQAITTINPDRSGELRTEVGFSAEERRNMEDQQGGAQNFCGETQGQGGLFPPQSVTTEEQRGDETWCVTTTRFANLLELRELYEDKAGLTVNRLEISDNRLTYNIDIDTLSEGSSFANFTAIGWKVNLPGAALVHNADLAGKNALSWNIQPRSGVANVRFESVVERPPLDPILLIAVVAAIFLIGVTLGSLLALFLRRRKTPT